MLESQTGRRNGMNVYDGQYIVHQVLINAVNNLKLLLKLATKWNVNSFSVTSHSSEICSFFSLFFYHLFYTNI